MQVTPISFKDSRFLHMDVTQDLPTVHSEPPFPRPVEPERPHQQQPLANYANGDDVHPRKAPPTDDGHEVRLSQMVDDLVGPEEDDDCPRAVDRLQAVPSPWEVGMALPQTPPLANGRGNMSYTSPNGSQYRNGHSRVNSATSNRSRNSLHQPDTLSSFAPTPPYSKSANERRHGHDRLSNGYAVNNGLGYDPNVNSPLLFGAGNSPWSTNPRRSVNNDTPPNGQGG